MRKRPYFYHISEKYLLSYDFHCLNSLVTYHPIIIGTNLRALKKCFKVLLLHQDQTTTRSAGSRSWFVVGMIFYLWCREAVVCKHLKISDFISTIMCIVQSALKMLFIISDKMWWSGYDMNKTDPDIEIFWCKKTRTCGWQKDCFVSKKFEQGIKRIYEFFVSFSFWF